VEAIRDSILAVSGRLNTKMYGPSVYPEIPPAALEGSSDPDKIWKASSEEEASRRTVYVFLKPVDDRADAGCPGSCDTARSAARRQNTSVATQALTLFNGDFVNQQRAISPDGCGARRATTGKANRSAWRLALARPPKASRRGHAGFLETRAAKTNRCAADFST